MGIILTILKILGIILLILLGLILFAGCLVAFVPVRYRVEGGFPEGEKPRGKVRVTWLFSLLHLSAGYEKELTLSVRVLGIRVWPRKPGSSKQQASRKKAEKPPVTEEKEALPASPQEAERAATAQPMADEKPDRPQEGAGTPGAGGAAAQGHTAEETPPVKNGKDGERKSILERLGDLLEKIAAWIEAFAQNAEAALDRLAGKIAGLKSIYDHYMNLIESQDTRLFLKKLYGIGRRVLRSIRPKKLRANLEIGCADPAMTANILAVRGLLYPLVGEDVRITPDFEKTRLQGDFMLKGRVRICVLLISILQIICDKRFWRLIRQLKKGGSN